MDSISAQIYKAEWRGKTESAIFRSLMTFNFGNYQEKSRKPFGALQVLNDDTLAPQNKIVLTVEENTTVIILPLVGGVDFKNSLGDDEFVSTGQIRIFTAATGMHFGLFNPYEEDLVNYIQIWITNKNDNFDAGSFQENFEFSERNQLIPLYAKDNTVLQIGIFDGRKDGVYELQNPKNALFAFVINGAFEFENRLLESRDGLALSGIDSVEFEALSENAIVLVLEIYQ